MKNPSQGIKNHIGIVLDASTSMRTLSQAVIQVADKLIQDMASMSGSDQFDQETRITLYTFADNVTCVFDDMDVERAKKKSIKDLYKADGNTALLKATHTAIEDMSLVSEKYGDHSFLLFVITDGEENVSDRDPWGRPLTGQKISYHQALPAKIASLPEHWTLGVLVPNALGVHRAKQYGFPAGCISVWDATSARGVEEAGRTIMAATTSYMTSRASGLRGTKSLFQTNVGAIDTSAVQAALTPLDINSYALAPVLTQTTTSEFVAEYLRTHPGHQVGDVFYQLTGSKATKGKRGIIVQGHKPVAVMERSSSRVYTGPEARKLVGLPDHNVTVDPTDEKGDYLLFVRSDASNRILYPGTKFLMMVR